MPFRFSLNKCTLTSKKPLILPLFLAAPYCMHDLKFPNQGSNLQPLHWKYVCVCACSVASAVSNSATLWTVARQAPLSMGFSRQEYGSGLPFLLPGDLPNPGIELVSLASPALAGRFFTTSIAVEVQGLNHWAAREVPTHPFK